MMTEEYEALGVRVYTRALGVLVDSGDVDHEALRRLVVSRSVDVLVAPSLQVTARWVVHNPGTAASNLRAQVAERWILPSRDAHSDLSHPALASSS